MASRPPAAVDTTADVAVDASSAPAAPSAARETDPRRLEQRQKQIDFGKNTRGYARYVAAVPRAQRRALHGGLVPVDPVTPDIHQACSKRAFDGQVRKWRRMLHAWDPVEEGDDPSGPAAPAVGLTSPGAGKRGASARTPATAGRRKVGRIGGEEEEGKGGAVPAQPAFGEVADVAP